LIYKNQNFINLTNDFPVFRGSMLEWDNTSRRGTKSIVFKEYSPEKFYLLNKIIIEYTRSHYNESNRFIFINAWNEWGEGTYLEPDDKYGYSSINSLSKALFNLPYILHNINNLNSTNSSKIIVQINLSSDDMINEIINKINNIPFKFDLFISTNSLERIQLIQNNIKRNKKFNKYYIIMIDKSLKNTRRLFKIFNIFNL
jgi:lipopolysaccharide biosynthesis protein